MRWAPLEEVVSLHTIDIWGQIIPHCWRREVSCVGLRTQHHLWPLPTDASSVVFPVKNIKNISRNIPYLAVQWLRLCLPMQGVWVRSLVGELRSPMPQGQKNPSINQKQYCNKQRLLKWSPLQKKKNFKKYLQILLNVPLGGKHTPD